MAVKRHLFYRVEMFQCLHPPPHLETAHFVHLAICSCFPDITHVKNNSDSRRFWPLRPSFCRCLPIFELTRTIGQIDIWYIGAIHGKLLTESR